MVISYTLWCLRTFLRTHLLIVKNCLDQYSNFIRSNQPKRLLNLPIAVNTVLVPQYLALTSIKLKWSLDTLTLVCSMSMTLFKVNQTSQVEALSKVVMEENASTMVFSTLEIVRLL
jgi:hypothetical protein